MDTIIKDFKKESRRRKRQEKIDSFKKKVNETMVWVNDNKEVLIILIPAVAGAVKFTSKTIGNHINIRKEEQLKNLYCYDRSLGHYWKLRRELTNSEWIEIDRRKKQGERLADILDELKVLK